MLPCSFGTKLMGDISRKKGVLVATGYVKCFDNVSYQFISSFHGTLALLRQASCMVSRPTLPSPRGQASHCPHATRAISR